MVVRSMFRTAQGELVLGVYELHLHLQPQLLIQRRFVDIISSSRPSVNIVVTIFGVAKEERIQVRRGDNIINSLPSSFVHVEALPHKVRHESGAHLGLCCRSRSKNRTAPSTFLAHTPTNSSSRSLASCQNTEGLTSHTATVSLSSSGRCSEHVSLGAHGRSGAGRYRLGQSRSLQSANLA